MANEPQFKSDRSAFNHKHESFIELVTSRMAVQTESYLKISSGMPVKTGRMKSATRSMKNSRGSWRTVIDVEYAGYQEAGARADGSHIVQNYSSPGSSSGFFQRAIDNNNKNKESIIKEAKAAVGL